MKPLAAVVLISALAGQSFEVASVKPNSSGSGHSDVDTDGNLLRMNNVTLKAWFALLSIVKIRLVRVCNCNNENAVHAE